jgi:hypothetical protein
VAVNFPISAVALKPHLKRCLLNKIWRWLCKTEAGSLI